MTYAAMDETEAINPSKAQVVDPEVRAYVYSLVTAVSRKLKWWKGTLLFEGRLIVLGSSVVLQMMNRTDMCPATTRWDVFETLESG